MLIHYSEIFEGFIFFFIAGIITDNIIRYKFNKWKQRQFPDKQNIKIVRSDELDISD